MPSRRSRAREVALQLLFQKDLNPGGIPRAELERFARERLLEDPALTEYCLELYDGAVQHQGEIDPRLVATAENWRLNRMAPVDRNVLRLGTYELLFDPSAPPVQVVIDEAVELSRRFGTKESPAFVNGILDKIARERNAEPGKSGDEAPPPEAPPGEPFP